MRKRLALLAFIALPATAQEQLPGAEQFHLRVEYWNWNSKLDAQFAKGPGSLPGTPMDTTLDLGMPDKNNHEWRATLRLGEKHRLRFGYTRLDYAGSVTARQDYIFNHAVFKKDDRLTSTLKGGYYTADFDLGLAQGSWGTFGLLFGAKIADVQAVLSSPGTIETAKLTAPAPILGAAGRAYFGRVSLSGEVSGLTVGKYGHVFEMDLGARLHLSDRLAVGAGYRLLKVRGVDDPDFLDFHLDGAHFGVELEI
jgi:hypothetical protein